MDLTHLVVACVSGGGGASHESHAVRLVEVAEVGAELLTQGPLKRRFGAADNCDITAMAASSGRHLGAVPPRTDDHDPALLLEELSDDARVLDRAETSDERQVPAVEIEAFGIRARCENELGVCELVGAVDDGELALRVDQVDPGPEA